MNVTHTKKRLVRVRGGRPLSGSVRVPVDLQIAERVLLMAALGDGRSQLQTPGELGPALPLLRALASLGVPIDGSPTSIAVQGVGLSGLVMPSGPLACERSFSSLALCSGLLAGQHFGTRVTVHPSLASRPVTQIVGPLRARGAQIAGRRSTPESVETPPISVAPLLDDERLLGLRCELPEADADAKTAVLISGLFSPLETTLSEPLVSADHTERLFVSLGLPLRRVGSVLQFDPSGWDRRIPAQRDVSLPGCTTCAAYLATAALLTPGSRIALGHAGLNPSRAGFFDVLRSWGANVQVLPRGDAAGREPVADLIVQHGALRGGVLGGELMIRARAELHALAAIGRGTLRAVSLFDLPLVTPGDPQGTALQTLLAASGVQVERRDDALHVHGESPHGAAHTIDARDDAELAMAAIVLGLTRDAETVIEQGAEALELVHPGFLAALGELGAQVDIAETA